MKTYKVILFYNYQYSKDHIIQETPVIFIVKAENESKAYKLAEKEYKGNKTYDLSYMCSPYKISTKRKPIITEIPENEWVVLWIYKRIVACNSYWYEMINSKKYVWEMYED